MLPRELKPSIVVPYDQERAFERAGANFIPWWRALRPRALVPDARGPCPGHAPPAIWGYTIVSRG